MVDFKKTMPEDELVRVIGEYDGLVVRSATKVLNLFLNLFFLAFLALLALLALPLPVDV